jgi:ABC-type lipoprotein export system ATPase subunit
MLLDLHHSQKTILILVTHNPSLAARFPMRLNLAGRHLEKV